MRLVIIFLIIALIAGIIILFMFLNKPSNQPLMNANYIKALKLVIKNNQSVSTPPSFELPLLLNKSNLGKDVWENIVLNPLNILFKDSSGNILYAWIENISTRSILIWVKIPTSIPANSDYTLYMYITDKMAYPYTGINPFLASEKFGISPRKYDNGDKVFSFYYSFAGLSSFPSDWGKYHPECLVYNFSDVGITLESKDECYYSYYSSDSYNASGAGIYYLGKSWNNFSSPFIIESWGKISKYHDTCRSYPLSLLAINSLLQNKSEKARDILLLPRIKDLPEINFVGIGAEDYYYYSVYYVFSLNNRRDYYDYLYPFFYRATKWALYQITIIDNNLADFYFWNIEGFYGSRTSSLYPTDYSPTKDPLYITLYTYGASITITWIRIRGYPPNGVMPEIVNISAS